MSAAPKPGDSALALLYKGEDAPPTDERPVQARHDHLIATASSLASAARRRNILSPLNEVTFPSLADVVAARAASGFFGSPELGRDGPVDSDVLRELASEAFDPETWSAVEDEFNSFASALTKSTRRVKNLIPTPLRTRGHGGNPPRKWAALAAAGAMAPWLREMPFNTGNMWCAELHCYSAMSQFDIPHRPGGIAGCPGYTKHSYVEAVFRAVSRAPEPNAVQNWLSIAPESEEVLSRHANGQTVADLALVLMAIQPDRGF